MEGVGGEVVGMDNVGVGNGEVEGIDVMLEMRVWVFRGMIVRIVS